MLLSRSVNMSSGWRRANAQHQRGHPAISISSTHCIVCSCQACLSTVLTIPSVRRLAQSRTSTSAKRTHTTMPLPALRGYAAALAAVFALVLFLLVPRRRCSAHRSRRSASAMYLCFANTASATGKLRSVSKRSTLASITAAYAAFRRLRRCCCAMAADRAGASGSSRGSRTVHTRGATAPTGSSWSPVASPGWCRSVSCASVGSACSCYFKLQDAGLCVVAPVVLEQMLCRPHNSTLRMGKQYVSSRFLVPTCCRCSRQTAARCCGS